MKTRPSPRIKTAFENERFEDDLRKQLADLAHNIKVTPSNTVNNKENFSYIKDQKNTSNKPNVSQKSKSTDSRKTHK